jgi:uncharacterized protein
MLQVDLRELSGGPANTQAELGAADPLFEGLGVVLAGPVRVTGRLHAAGEGRFFWQASLRAPMAGECRRCLAPVPVTVAADIRALFTQDPDALDDPDCYPVARDATQIDLRPAVREELLLAVPRWVVCREDCPGLCPRCGTDLNAGPCGCPPAGDPRWQALAAFKGKPRD